MSANAPDRRGKHGNHVSGSKHPRWNDERILTPQGYVLIRVGRSHPMADANGHCREHDLIMSAAISRPLRPGEVVHHRNGDISDNRLENLELMTIREHNAKHGRVKLNEEQVRQIRERYASGAYDQPALALAFGVRIQTISRIVRGRLWADAGGPIVESDMRSHDASGRFARAGRLLDGVEHNGMPDKQ